MVDVAIKVRIGLKENGHHDYPQWGDLPMAEGKGTYIEREQFASLDQKIKWKYDKVSGHQEDEPDSPRGTQWGMMIVSEQFADEALAMWPDRVFEMTEAEAEEFWTERAHKHVPDNKHDTDVLRGLALERELTLILDRSANTDVIDAAITKALDPNHPNSGVRRTKGKIWAEAKASYKLNIRKSS